MVHSFALVRIESLLLVQNFSLNIRGTIFYVLHTIRFWDPGQANASVLRRVALPALRAIVKKTRIPSEPSEATVTTQRFLWRALLFLGISILLGTESYLYNKPKIPDAVWFDFVIYPMPLWLPWIFLVPLVVQAARRFRLDRGLDAKILGIHLLILVCILLIHFVCMSALLGMQYGFVGGTPVINTSIKIFQNTSFEQPIGWSIRNMVVYGVVLAVSYTNDYRRELRDREVQASRLEGQLTKAQLHSLKSQLHPHFLFNSLNAISTLMRTDMDSAERMLDMLADLLRRSLQDSAVQVVPLHHEMEFVSCYLDIELVRFSNRLKVVIDIPPDVKEALVPHLILQPLVENAIRHGIGPKLGPGTVCIRARREEGTLILQVSDDGVGPGTRRTKMAAKGIGLANTRSRLDQLFGSKAQMECGPVPDGGYQVTLQFPFSVFSGVDMHFNPSALGIGERGI
jgi:signal transduction histidine kinase